MLPNGIVILVRENHTSPAVVVDGDLRTGALWETREKAGLADFTTAALMRGTEARAFGEIYEAIESVGASLASPAAPTPAASMARDWPKTWACCWSWPPRPAPPTFRPSRSSGCAGRC